MVARRAVAGWCLRGAGAAVLLSGALAVPARGGEGAPPEPLCRARAEVTPRRPYVGQQVLYRVRITRREEVSDLTWIEPLTFPSFRVEWLPGRTPDPRIADVGTHELVHEERRALYPALAGSLTIPGARLRCRSPEGSEPREGEARLEPVTLEVQPLPEEGRPAGFSGVVGPAEIVASVGRREIRLGEGVAVTVTARGPGNLWLLEPLLAPEPSEGNVEVFARPARLFLDRGERLTVRLSLRYDLVPRQPGILSFAPLQASTFDPDDRRYGTTRLSLPSVRVLRGASRVETEPAGEPEAAPNGRVPEMPGRVPSLALRVLVLGAAVALLAIGAWRLRRRLRRASATKALLAEARRAEAGGDPGAPAALERALRITLESRRPGAGALAPGALRAGAREDPVLEEAAGMLERLGAARFAPGGAAGAPTVREVATLIRKL